MYTYKVDLLVLNNTTDDEMFPRGKERKKA